jgi:hypothetical protein
MGVIGYYWILKECKGRYKKTDRYFLDSFLPLFFPTLHSIVVNAAATVDILPALTPTLPVATVIRPVVIAGSYILPPSKNIPCY